MNFHSLKINGFLRSVLVLVGGTAFSQAIAVLCLPFLTRIYSPDAFNTFAFYSAWVGMFSVIACLRYEMGLPLLRRKVYVRSLLLATMLIALVFSLMLGLILFILNKISPFSNGLPKELYLIPFGVGGLAIFNALNYFFISNEKFKIISVSRIVQSLVGAGSQIGFGLAGWLQFGLILGQLVSSICGIVFQFLRKNFLINRRQFKLWLLLVKRLLKRLHRFPIYSAPEAFANTAGIQLPIILISSLAIDAEAGYLLLAMKIMQAPVSLIGGAVSQVFYSKASSARHDGSLNDLVVNSVSGLAKVGVFPLVFFGMISPVFCKIVFGDEWARSGVLISWMIPWFIMQLLASPISTVMHVMNKQSLMLLLTIAGFILRVGMVVSAYYILQGHEAEAYAISGGIFYFICFVLFSINASVTISSYLLIFKRILFFVVAGVLAGMLFNRIIGLWL